jgi:hypothetical protein
MAADTPVIQEVEQVAAEGGSGPDLCAAELLPAAVGGGEDKKKSTFALLTVVGAALPSTSSKFVGTTPKAAVMKAARRIHKRSGKTDFVVLMRRVASHKVDKKLYKYAVTMKKRARPTGFVTITDPRFVVEKEVRKRGVVVKSVGDIEINVAKKVPIVQSSDHPVYGFVADDGTLEKGPAAASAKFVVVRPADTNTLYLVVAGTIPETINGVAVVKTDWDVHSLEDAAITDAEREEYDVAGQAKIAGEDASKKRAEAAKALAERKKLKAREDKAKETARAKRDKERARRDASKAKAQERKLKSRGKAAKTRGSKVTEPSA